MGSETPTFGLIDYIVFVLTLLISVAIGIYTSLSKNVSPEEFLMGNRAFSPIPVAMSLLTSAVSAISLLGYTGETYAYGLELMLFIIGIVFGIGIAAVISLPVIYPLRLTSVNEYIELRFRSPGLRKTILAITTFQALLYLGVCLYAPTIALATVTPLSYMTYIYVLGAVVTLYSSIGGIRAVVWTDVFQLSVMFIGLVVIFSVGLAEAGGFETVYNLSLSGGRLTNFRFTLDIYERHTIANTFTLGIFLYSSFYGVSQINVQRICSVRSMKAAKIVLLLNGVGMIGLFIFIFGEGLIAYATYAGCDPMELGLITKKEEIMPFFIVDRLSFITGLPGLFVATLIGGSLSSLSSYMSAIVAMIWKDFCSNLRIFSKLSPSTAGVINKIFSAITGVIAIGGAILASKSTSLIQLTLSMSGVLLGGVYGVFLLGLLTPKTNNKGVWIGLCFSNVFVSWISAGNFFYARAPEPLTFSTENCPSVSFNDTELTDGEYYSYNITERTTETLFPEWKNQYEGFLMNLYGISYTLYPVIGTCSCVLIGLIVSCLTGNRDLKTVSPNHITPLVRRFYWSKEDLQVQQVSNELYKSDSTREDIF